MHNNVKKAQKIVPNIRTKENSTKYVLLITMNNIDWHL